MLSVEENELVSRVGPGTPMGEVMRRYWLPALLSEEVAEPDCPPVRVKLLGEELIAFRDTNGRVGLMEERCPHRMASLWLGRNEECGLRCIYHGWKFDVDGNCVDQMNEPEQFGHKIKAVAYQTFEQGGVIFAYMGVPERTPPPPDFEYTRVPATHRSVNKSLQECNWLQGLEGGIDSSHAPILHRAFANYEGGIRIDSPFVRSSAPTLEVETTDYGYRYTAVRKLGEDEQYVRSYHFVMPFTQFRPNQTVNYGKEGRRSVVSGHHWVPIDDDNCMVWNWNYSFGDDVLDGDFVTMDLAGNGPRHIDAGNGYRAYGTRQNNWLMDRERQRTQNFSGIEGVNAQDRAVQESMGYTVDRSREHLGPADRAIIVARKILLQAVRTVQDGGTPPGSGETYYNIRAIEKVFSKDLPWRQVMLPEMYPGQAPPVAALA